MILQDFLTASFLCSGISPRNRYLILFKKTYPVFFIPFNIVTLPTKRCSKVNRCDRSILTPGF